MKFKSLKENELNNIVGGNGENVNTIGGCFKIGAKELIHGLAYGADGYYKCVQLINSVIHTDSETNRKFMAQSIVCGSSNFIGATVHYVGIGAMVYGCCKAGKFVINKIRKHK